MTDVLYRRLPETRIKGQRLGRHVQHDPRSRDFAVTPSTGLVSVRHKRHVPVYDQGQVGSCTGNAAAGAMSTAPFGHRYHETTAVRFYSAAEVIDGDGPYPPNDNGSSGLSVAKVLYGRGLISSYSHAFSPEAVYTALQTVPTLIGCSWLTGFDSPGLDGRMAYGGTSRGGHEIVADELDMENGRIWITNSWTPSWGIAGRAFWTLSDFANVLADYGDATIPNR